VLGRVLGLFMVESVSALSVGVSTPRMADGCWSDRHRVPGPQWISHPTADECGTNLALRFDEPAARSTSDRRTPVDEDGRRKQPQLRRGAGRAIARIGGFGVLAIVIILVIAAFALNPFKKTPRELIGLSYGGGPFEGARFQQVVQPGSNLFFNGWGDPLFLYPVTQRNYIISKQAEEGDVGGSDFVPAPSADRIEVDYEVAVYFKLNLSKVQDFHETIGLKYRAWCDEGDETCSVGWERMLRDSFRQQIEFALQRESRRYPVADIYADQKTLIEIQSDVGTVLKENVNEILGDDYFCGPTYSLADPTTCPDFEFVIKRVTIPQDVLTAFEANRTSEIAVLTKQNEVKQAEFESQAIQKRQQALERCGQICVLYDAVKSGVIDFWVLPNSQGLNLTLPARSG
jgi:hypothetical protein